MPQTVHGYSCAIVRVSHIDDRLSDGLDHLLLTSQQSHQAEALAIVGLEKIKGCQVSHRPLFGRSQGEKVQKDFVDQRVFDHLFSANT